jgi:hypothetical protein
MLDNVLFLGATSNSTPSPLVMAASSIYSSSYDAFTAFSQAANGFGWLSGGSTEQKYLQIDFGSAYVIAKYLICPSSFTPNGWTIEASNTGAFSGEQVTVDVQSGLSLSSFTWASFSLSDMAAYRYWRLVLGTGSYEGVTQWSFVPASSGGGSTVIVVDD